MIGPRGLGCVVLLAAGTMLAGGPAMASDMALIASPDMPGPQQPMTGRSLFDELFWTPSGYDIPYPFERLLDALNARIAPARVRTALIPLGRSLQRYAADPDYFESPRLVVAVTADAAGPMDGPRLKDRLFLGYQPAAEAIEAISYNEAAGRFEFQEITDYGSDRPPRVGYAAREICVGCHQAHAPIFSRPLWSESNANPAVADKLGALGTSYHGAPVRQGIDGLDDFDQSTDRANRSLAINHVWDRGCGAGQPGVACRAALLEAALEYRLTGARSDWMPSTDVPAADRLLLEMTRLWPAGLGAPDPDLPNADPVAELTAGRATGEILESDGARNPASSRAPLPYWWPNHDSRTNFATLARDVAMLFSLADIAWLDQELATQPIPATSFEATCRTKRLDRDGDRTELRLDCGEDDDALRLSGFVILAGDEVEGGRIDSLTLTDAPPVRRLRIVGGEAESDGTGRSIRLDLRDDGAGIHPRLLSGERIAGFRLRDDDTAVVDIVADLNSLDRAVDTLARGDSAALGPGPLHRRAVLSGLALSLAEP